MAESSADRRPLALIANHEEWSIRSLESILAPHGYAALRAYTGHQALELAREVSPDFVIIDWDFTDIQGVEVCRLLREDPRISPCTPILITTAGRRTREKRLEALSAGAWNFMALPLDADELLLRLDLYMKLKSESDRIRDDSLVDGITGYYNLKGLMRRARELGTDAYRHRRPLACVAVAPVHQNGEATSASGANGHLRTTVERLAKFFRSTSRSSDAIGRVRRDEFLLIAPGTDQAGALKLAKRLLAAAESDGDDNLPRLKLRAGYDAVHDAREAGSQPAALMAGATTALRQSRAAPEGPAIRRYAADSQTSTGS